MQNKWDKKDTAFRLSSEVCFYMTTWYTWLNVLYVSLKPLWGDLCGSVDKGNSSGSMNKIGNLKTSEWHIPTQIYIYSFKVVMK